MTFKELRNILHHRSRLIRWTKSRIVEQAQVTETGAIRITNFISNKSYILPRYDEPLEIEVVPDSESYIILGDLLPKSLRK